MCTTHHYLTHKTNFFLTRAWKGLQLRAGYEVLQQQWSAGPASRSKALSVALTGGILWRINALHSRPATGGSVHALHLSTLPVTSTRHHPELFSGRNDNPHAHANDSASGSDGSTSDSGEDQFQGPVVPYGAVFLRSIRLPGDPGGKISCPRMDAQFNHAAANLLPYKAYRGVVGMSQYDVALKYGRLVQSSRPAAAPRRMARPRGQLPFPPDPAPDDASAMLTIPAMVTQAFAPDFDEGDDLHPEERMQHPEQEIDHDGFTDDVVRVMNAFCSQVLQHIPPPKRSNPGQLGFYHSCRNADDPTIPTIANFTNPDLWLSGFTQIQSREPHKDDWEDRFEVLFPPKFRIIRQNEYGRPRKPDAGRQWNYEGLGGFKHCSYLETWMNIMARCSPEGALALRAQVKAQFFDTLVWCPWADRHKLWTTSITDAYRIHFPQQPSAGHGAPRVCFNPAKRSTVMWEGSLVFPGVPASNLRTIGRIPASL